MSCDTNRQKLLHKLAPLVGEHFALPKEEAASLLETSFQRATYRPDLSETERATAEKSAQADCQALFSAADEQGIALGHRGLPKNFQKVLGYATLRRIERATISPELPMPPVTIALAREKYNRLHCPECGRFYNPAQGCQHSPGGQRGAAVEAMPTLATESQSTDAAKSKRRSELLSQPHLQTQRPIPPQPSKDTRLPFFVYGTLRTGQGNWERLLKGKTSIETPATLPGAKMYSRGIAYVFDALASEPPSQVVGNLVWLSEESQEYAGVRASLDSLEGYSPRLDDGHYRRVAREVEYTDEDGDQQTVLAWVYHGGENTRASVTEKERITGGDWLANRMSSLVPITATSPVNVEAAAQDDVTATDNYEAEEEDIGEWEYPLEDDSTRFYGKLDNAGYTPWDVTEDRDAVAENAQTKLATPATSKAKAQQSKLKSVKEKEKELTEPQRVYYFAFGSNMSESRMRQRNVKYTARFAATLAGYRLSFNKKSGVAGKGFANIVPDSKGQVVGVVYETNPAGITSLDRYEGVPVHYYRETVNVQAGSRGGTISAIVYIAQPAMCQKGLKPTQEYLDYLLGGQDVLPEDYTAKLARQKTIVEPKSPSTSSYGVSSSSGWRSTLKNPSYSSGLSSTGKNNSSKVNSSNDYYSGTLWDNSADGYSSYSGSSSGSSSSYSSYYKSSESFKRAKFNDALRELLGSLDLDLEVSYELEEVLYALSQRRGVSERQIFKLALLRALNNLVEET